MFALASFKPEEKTVAVTGVKIDRNEAGMIVKETITLKAAVQPDDATNKNITWSAVDKSIATVDPETGKVTAVSVGKTIITVTTEDGGKTDQCTVTVTEEPGRIHVESVTVKPETATLAAGKTLTLEAAVAPDNATDKTVKWESDTPSVATVDPATGIVTAMKKGNATITATATDGGKTGKCTVTVTEEPTYVPVESVTVKPETATLGIGKTLTLKAAITPDNATDKTVKWESNTPSVATVDPSTGLVTAISEGTATITATTVDGEKTGKCTVTVAETRPIITVTTAAKTVMIDLAGTGTVSIIFNGREETSALSSSLQGFSFGCSGKEPYNIVIIGNVTHMHCQKNELTDLYVRNAMLKELYCHENKLTTLDVSNCTALTRLNCYFNKLGYIDVTNNIALKELYCFKNQLTALDITKCAALEWLDCGENQLENLNVNKNTALLHLLCDENRLTNLDVNTNIALTELQCGTNPISTLDISNNTALRILVCYNNQLTSLDVRNNGALIDFWCSKNQLTTLDMSNNIALKEVGCDDNQFSTAELNALFGTLHNNTTPAKKVYVVNNPGTADCDKSIATLKGWDVVTEKSWPFGGQRTAKTSRLAAYRK